MKNSNSKNAMILFSIIVASGAVWYRSVFVVPPVDPTLSGVVISEKIASNFSKIESINFDTSIFNEPKFNTFESINAPFPSISSGKENPFASILSGR